MNDYYAVANTSKQAHHSAMRRRVELQDRFLLLSIVLAEERGKHPSMSLKKLYHCLAPNFVGRDAFVDFGMENGFEPLENAKKPKTSASSERIVYPNLLRDLKIWDIDQVWTSDITYFKIKSAWHYISLIEDLYSRRIIGFNASKNMFALANLETFTMALNTRNIAKFGNKLVHHSDRGSQYHADIYVQAILKAEIKISMGQSCFDNVYMESANRIVKKEYLIHRNINSLDDLTFHLKKDINLYNAERPHGSLNKMTPIQFERYISNIPITKRTLMPVFTSKRKKHISLLPQDDPMQLKLNFPRF